METALLLLSIQGFIGAYDSIYHHEFKERLSLKESASLELKIHSMRSILYCVLFLSFGWIEWHGLLAVLFTLILVVELILTLWDFVVEDQTRDLPHTERITHTVLALNFGAILALLAPALLDWYHAPTGFALANHGIYSWIMTLYGVGVIPFAIREYTSYRNLKSRESKATGPAVYTSSFNTKYRILITGGTGFIGKQLCETLLAQGHSLTLLARDFKKAGSLFGSAKRVTLISNLAQLHSSDQFDVVINLAGDSIVDGRWSNQKKQRIIASRINTTRQLIEYIKKAHNKPEVLISGSAIGYYGPRKDDIVTESTQGMESFSHKLCAKWELAAREAERFGVRVCLLRTGIVLGKTGGALASMLIPFTYGLGGKLGNGQQWMSWIHIDDMINIILQAIDNKKLAGPINATAPNPVRNKTFTQTLGHVLHRPTLLTIPSIVLHHLLGEVADELFLSGQKVIPKKLLDSDFCFQYPTLRPAMEDIVRS